MLFVFLQLINISTPPKGQIVESQNLLYAKPFNYTKWTQTKWTQPDLDLVKMDLLLGGFLNFAEAVVRILSGHRWMRLMREKKRIKKNKYNRVRNDFRIKITRVKR